MTRPNKFLVLCPGISQKLDHMAWVHVHMNIIASLIMRVLKACYHLTQFINIKFGSEFFTGCRKKSKKNIRDSSKYKYTKQRFCIWEILIRLCLSFLRKMSWAPLVINYSISVFWSSSKYTKIFLGKFYFSYLWKIKKYTNSNIQIHKSWITIT